MKPSVPFTWTCAQPVVVISFTVTFAPLRSFARILLWALAFACTSADVEITVIILTAMASYPEPAACRRGVESMPAAAAVEPNVAPASSATAKMFGMEASSLDQCQSFAPMWDQAPLGTVPDD